MNRRDVEVVFAHHQTEGEGRFGRKWHSERGRSLTFSIALSEYGNHPKPWQIGMGVAVVCAELLDCSLRWPNDLDIEGNKVGGLLTQLRDPNRIPVIGIGVNLRSVAVSPESQPSVGSIESHVNPLSLAESICGAIASEDFHDWEGTLRRWRSRDNTKGKQYRTVTGEQIVGERIGDDGELITDSGSTVLAADALWGQND